MIVILRNTCDGSSGDHMGCQSLGTYTDVSTGDHINLAGLGTTYHGNSREHMPWHSWGRHVIAFLGSKCDDSGGYRISMAVLGKLCNGSIFVTLFSTIFFYFSGGGRTSKQKTSNYMVEGALKLDDCGCGW